MLVTGLKDSIEQGTFRELRAQKNLEGNLAGVDSNGGSKVQGSDAGRIRNAGRVIKDRDYELDMEMHSGCLIDNESTEPEWVREK